jgi:hypothetical protein
VILDKEENIFGGFTPVEWESSKKGKAKADPSEKSFLFTLKNPHNIPARRFALKAEEKDMAILCGSEYGPFFAEICIQHNCNTTDRNFVGFFGKRYTNDTGLPGETFFTNSKCFRVKEIEVFEITD